MKANDQHRSNGHAARVELQVQFDVITHFPINLIKDKPLVCAGSCDSDNTREYVSTQMCYIVTHSYTVYTLAAYWPV
jgi:hypothetical protein